MPLTSAQFDRLGASAVARRLSNRHQHFLALKITSYLRLSKCRQRVLEHWASRKILCSPDVDDTALCQIIRKQLLQEENKRTQTFRAQRQRRVSYATIANTALKLNRTDLSKRLLEFETNPAASVPLYLRMGAYVVVLSLFFSTLKPIHTHTRRTDTKRHSIVSCPHKIQIFYTWYFSPHVARCVDRVNLMCLTHF